MILGIQTSQTTEPESHLMSLGQIQGDDVLSSTLERLRGLYKERRIQPGDLTQVGIKSRWTLVTGSGQVCGISCNITGQLPDADDPADFHTIAQIQAMITRPLFDTAATGIRSDNPLIRSVGLAALSGLSQRFLSCTAVRKRGYLSECWIATDPLIAQYPILSRIVTTDDMVVMIGQGDGEIRALRGKCRQLHVLDTCSPDKFSTVLIDSSVRRGSDNVIIHTRRQDPELLRSADVILLNASTLIDGTFTGLMRYTDTARLVGLTGLSGSLIPDAFFEQGLDFISSYRITDPQGFSEAVMNEYDINYAMNRGQKQYLMMNPSART